jgi:hypothetical protein
VLSLVGRVGLRSLMSIEIQRPASSSAVEAQNATSLQAPDTVNCGWGRSVGPTHSRHAVPRRDVPGSDRDRRVIGPPAACRPRPLAARLEGRLRPTRGRGVPRGASHASPGETWNGRTRFDDGFIEVTDHLDPPRRVKALLHEWSHFALHHSDVEPDTPPARLEVEAESSTFLLCRTIGLDSTSYSIP